MSERVILAATNVSIGLLLGGIGYLVRERRMMHLISGDDPSAVTDEAGGRTSSGFTSTPWRS